MSSKILRVGVVGLPIIFAVAMASAQERRTTVPVEREGIQVFNPIEGRAVVLSSRPESASPEG